MGHYSDAYERDEDRYAELRAKARREAKKKIEHDLKVVGTAEVLIRMKEGYYSGI